MPSRARRQSPRFPSSAVTSCARETEALGKAFAQRLEPGDCVCLTGPLGAGKTTFIRGVMRRLGVRGPVTSPTFTLAHEASGSICGRAVDIAHLDFYRLTVPAAERGLLEYLDGRHIVLVEWAERDRSFWPRRAIKVKIVLGRGSRRTVGFSFPRGSG